MNEDKTKDDNKTVADLLDGIVFRKDDDNFALGTQELERAESVPPNPSVAQEESAFGFVAEITHVKVKTNKEHEPLRIGSSFKITGTDVSLGRVERVIGPARQRSYIVRLHQESPVALMNLPLAAGVRVSRDEEDEARGKRKVTEEPGISRMNKRNTSMAWGNEQNQVLAQVPAPRLPERYQQQYLERLFRGGSSGSAVNQSSVNQQQYSGLSHAPLRPELNPNVITSQTQSQGVYARQSFQQGGAIRPGGLPESTVHQNYNHQQHLINTAPRPEAFPSQDFPHPNQQMHLQHTQSHQVNAGQFFYQGVQGRDEQMQAQFNQGGRGGGLHMQPQFHQGVGGGGLHMQPQFHQGGGGGGLHMQPQFHQGVGGGGLHMQPQFHQGGRGQYEHLQQQLHRGGRGQDQHLQQQFNLRRRGRGF